MKHLTAALQGIAFFLILAAALCADGLSEQPDGFAVLFLMVCAAGGLVGVSNLLEILGEEGEPCGRKRPSRASRHGHREPGRGRDA